MGLFASVGIVKDKPFNPDARMKKILTDAANIGAVTARTIAFKIREKDAYFYSDSIWRLTILWWLQVRGLTWCYQSRWAHFLLHFATGVTPAMEMKMVGEGSQYPWSVQDSKGNPFDGSKDYKMHLPRTFRSRTSGPLSCTTIKRAQWSRPIRSRRA
jgi:hypothetical protein